MFLASVKDFEELERATGAKADYAVTIHEVVDGIKYSLIGIDQMGVTRKQVARQLRAIAKDLMRSS